MKAYPDKIKDIVLNNKKLSKDDKNGTLLLEASKRKKTYKVSDINKIFTINLTKLFTENEDKDKSILIDSSFDAINKLVEVNQKESV